MKSITSSYDDADLIRQTLAGHVSSFEQLVDRYQNRLFHSMTHVLSNSTDAEDVVQDAFVKAYSKLDTFRGGSQFYTWLYRIAHNTAISQLRKQKNHRSNCSLEDSAGALAAQVEADAAPPSARLERQEQLQQLKDALDRLSSEHRAILVMREIDGLDYDAIAQVLDIAVGTVRSRLHRARSQLKDELERASSQKV
jgi:RNA polymerase sigma-70 factor (ECF subfamily)